jgi:hypothetical protein
MIDFELRPPPGATDALVPKKHRDAPPRPTSVPRKPRVVSLRAAVRTSLRRYACPCGCGRSRWFSQTRVTRGSGPA